MSSRDSHIRRARSRDLDWAGQGKGAVGEEQIGDGGFGGSSEQKKAFREGIQRAGRRDKEGEEGWRGFLYLHHPRWNLADVTGRWIRVSRSLPWGGPLMEPRQVQGGKLQIPWPKYLRKADS